MFCTFKNHKRLIFKYGIVSLGLWKNNSHLQSLHWKPGQAGSYFLGLQTPQRRKQQPLPEALGPDQQEHLAPGPRPGLAGICAIPHPVRLPGQTYLQVRRGQGRRQLPRAGSSSAIHIPSVRAGGESGRAGPTYHDHGDPGGGAVLFGERVIKVLF